MKVLVTRKEHFNAAHRLYNKNWTFERNDEIFGLCNNPNYHGHNYELEVTLKGDIDPDTGFVFDMKQLGELVKTEIVNRFDHKNLNVDCHEFSNLNPTAENIAVVIWDILRQKISIDYGLTVKLYETERNFVEYGGE